MTGKARRTNNERLSVIQPREDYTGRRDELGKTAHCMAFSPEEAAVTVLLKISCAGLGHEKHGFSMVVVRVAGKGVVAFRLRQ